MYYKISYKSQGNNLIEPFLDVIMFVKSTSAFFGLCKANEHQLLRGCRGLKGLLGHNFRDTLKWMKTYTASLVSSMRVNHR